MGRLKLPAEGGRTTRSGPTWAKEFVETVLKMFPPGAVDKKDGASLAKCLESIIAQDYQRFILLMSGIRVPRPGS